jgi:hypothetical protein
MVLNYRPLSAAFIACRVSCFESGILLKILDGQKTVFHVI